MAKSKRTSIGRIKKSHGLWHAKTLRSSQIKAIKAKLVGIAKEEPISKIMLLESSFDCEEAKINTVRPLFDLERDQNREEESWSSFCKRAKKSMKIVTTDERWYKKQLKLAKKWKPRKLSGKWEGKVKVVYWKEKLTQVHILDNSHLMDRKMELLKKQVKNLMHSIGLSLASMYEKRTKHFDVDECIGYLKKHLTWSYFKTYAAQETRLPGVTKRSKCEESVRRIFSTYLKDVFELVIDVMYASVNSWERWGRKILEKRLREEEQSIKCKHCGKRN